MSAGPHVNKRKSVLRQVAKDLGVRKSMLCWINNQLCDKQTGEPIPGIDPVYPLTLQKGGVHGDGEASHAEA